MSARAARLIQTWRRWSMHPVVLPLTRVRVHVAWILAGRPVPAPPVIKQNWVRRELRRRGLRTFIETGTYTGEMVAAVLDLATRIVSIELHPELAARACERFRDHPHVTIVEGDSTSLLPPLVSALEAPALFWLDAHFTGPSAARGPVDSAIVSEIETLRRSRVAGHVVLIDDARAFDGRAGYPTLEHLRQLACDGDPQASFAIRSDVVRWVPGGGTRGRSGRS